MKKNITINLFGTLYCIDEDAYALLQKYTDSMKSYFARQEGGEEIADDIEHRVAELMWQKKEEGNEAIDLDMIKEIIAKIGNPAEIDGKEEETEEQETSKTYESSTNEGNKNKWNLNDRHLYRNPKDKKLGGVCSGLAVFFNKGKNTGINDATYWRLGFLVLSVLMMFYMPYWIPDVINISVPVLYVILWIIMPEAKTPEDMLRMKGKDVTPENINEEILREPAFSHQDNTQAHASYQQQQNNNSGCLKVILGVGLLIIGFPFIIALIAVIFSIGVSAFAIGGAATGLLGDLLTATPFESLPSLLGDMKWMIVLGLISALVVCVIPIYGIIRLVRSSEKKMSAWSIVTLIVIWVLCLAFGILGIASTVAKVAKGSLVNPHLDVHYEITVDEDEATSVDEDEEILSDSTFIDIQNDTVQVCYPDSI